MSPHSLYVVIGCRADSFTRQLFYSKERKIGMAKFNSTNTNKTINRSGFPAYTMAAREHLVSAVLTTMFGEPKFYGTTDNDIVRLAAQ